jgi:hypothetical protein
MWLMLKVENSDSDLVLFFPQCFRVLLMDPGRLMSKPLHVLNL